MIREIEEPLTRRRIRITAHFRHRHGPAQVRAIHAVELIALIVDVKRFATLGRLYSYAGLIRHDKMSGGRSYGKRQPRYSRELKRVLKMATISALGCTENKLTIYYEHLIKTGVAEHNARHACSRKLLAYIYGVLKTKRKLDPTKY